MLSAMFRKKGIGLLGYVRVWPVFFVAMVTLLVTAPKLWAIHFSQTSVVSLK